jgi:CheY-like chemotaxis protein
MLIRHTVCRFLEERGFTVESATNGVEALEILAKTRPNLIVTDLMMPKMGGSEFIASVKANPQTAAIPVVILAGKGSSGSPVEAEPRADFVIYKDIDIEQQLENAIASLCRPEA